MTQTFYCEFLPPIHPPVPSTAAHLLPRNTDNPSNTAQVLTSLAEALDDSNTNVDAVVPLLEEAIELFQRCLTLQEFRLSESQALQDSTTNTPDADTEDGGAPLTEPSPSQPPTTDEQWATILEPVTPSTLLDTILAQLETLTLLLSKTTASASRPLAWLDEYSTTLLTALPTYLTPLPERAPEAALTRANLLAALADATFRADRLAFPAYERAVYDAYRSLDLAADPKALSDKADAMLNFQASLRLHAREEQLPQQIVARWGAMTQAGAALAAAAKVDGVENLERIHLARGDAELLRFATRTLTGYPGSVDAGVLLRNAGVFYRGAANQAAVTGDQEAGRVRREAGIKNALVAALGGEMGLLGELLKTETRATREVLEEAVGDGLVEAAWLREAGIV